MMTVNERLAYARKKLHLTQAQFSEKICVSTGFLCSMEIGDRKINPRMIKIINTNHRDQFRVAGNRRGGNVCQWTGSGN